MELVRNFRLKIGNLLLRKKLAKTKRKVRYSNIEHVKKIGIVWDASQVSDFISVSKFYQKMHERDVDVKVFGYYPENNLPDQYTAIRYLTCLKKDEVNFFYHPVSPESVTFIKKRFDILIDINFNNLLPLKYLSSLSHASLKVGLLDADKNGENFDLMMEIKKPVDVGHYLDQTLYYLEMINSGQVEKVH